MSNRAIDLLRHSWKVSSWRPLVFGCLDAAALGPASAFWQRQMPWYAGKYVERRGSVVTIDGCRLDVSAPTFSTFQRGCFWLQRHEKPERIAVARFLDPDLPVIELGASTGLLSCLIGRRLRRPDQHVAVEANPDLIGILERNRGLNGGSFSIVHAALAYDVEAIEFTRGEDHLAGRAKATGRVESPIDSVTLRQLLDRFAFSRATLVCDVEGMEVELWRRERDTIVDRIPWLIVELHEPISGAKAVNGLIAEVQEAGFALIWERGWTRVFVRSAQPRA